MACAVTGAPPAKYGKAIMALRPRFPRLSRATLCSLVPALVLTTACTYGTATEPVAIGSSMPVVVGREYQVQPDGVLRLSLLSVDADSRCPTRAVCVWGGSVSITLGLRMGMGPTVPTPLMWGLEPGRRTTTAGGVRIMLDSLSPWPEVPGPMLAQSQYTAWLTVRAADP
jgi:hypothetical protein